METRGVLFSIIAFISKAHASVAVHSQLMLFIDKQQLQQADRSNLCVAQVLLGIYGVGLLLIIVLLVVSLINCPGGIATTLFILYIWVCL